MLLLNDIKQDNHFKKLLKIIGLTFLVFFIADALIGTSLTVGLEKYYGLNTDAEIALVGHSHMMLGVNKTMLENELNIPVANYTRAGVNIGDRHIMIRQLLNQNLKLKTVIYGVDGWSFTGEGLSVNSYALFYPFMGSKEVDQYVRSQASFSDYWMHKIVKTLSFDEALINSSLRGYLQNWSNLKSGEVDTVRLKKEIATGQFRRINNSNENIKILKQSIEELKSKNINVILLYVPTIDFYNQAEPKKFKETLEIIENFEQEFSNVRVLNYLEPFSHDYSLFFDHIHLNPKGQDLVTKQLLKDLKGLQKN